MVSVLKNENRIFKFSLFTLTVLGKLLSNLPVVRWRKF